MCKSDSPQVQNSSKTAAGVFAARLRQSDRTIERSSNRAIERSSIRASERSSDRPSHRAIEQSSDRTSDHKELIITWAPEVLLTCWLVRCATIFKTNLSKKSPMLSYSKNKLSMLKNLLPDHVSGSLWRNSPLKNVTTSMEPIELSEHVQINSKATHKAGQPSKKPNRANFFPTRSNFWTGKLELTVQIREHGRVSNGTAHAYPQRIFR